MTSPYGALSDELEGRAKADEEIFALLDLWDDLDGAIDRIVTALPGQMTAAAELLEGERLRFRERIQKFAFNAAQGSAALRSLQTGNAE